METFAFEGQEPARTANNVINPFTLKMHISAVVSLTAN